MSSEQQATRLIEILEAILAEVSGPRLAREQHQRSVAAQMQEHAQQQQAARDAERAADLARRDGPTLSAFNVPGEVGKRPWLKEKT